MLIGIPNKVVEKVISWNEGPERDDKEYDKKICHSLLLCLVSKTNLRSTNVSNAVMDFIKGMFMNQLSNYVKNCSQNNYVC